MMYDISDPKRLRKVAKLMEGYGTRLQHSVFLCDLSRKELALWQMELYDMMVMCEDSVVWVDLGAPDDSSINVLGTPRNLPPSGPMIF